MTRWELLALPKTQVENLSIFQPASPPSESIRTLSILLFAIAGLIFVVVEGVLVYNLLRFRQTTDEPSSEPPQVYGGTPIEIAWTVAPTLIVCILVLVLAHALGNRSRSPLLPGGRPVALCDGHRAAMVVGIPLRRVQRTSLAFHHRQRAARACGQRRRSERGRVYLNLQSADVVHSFWVPRLAGKTDLIPGTTNRMWFQPSEEGTFYGQCAEYCGAQHAGMLLRVIAEPPAQFERWLAQQKRLQPTRPTRRPARRPFWRSRASIVIACGGRRPRALTRPT